MTIMGNNKYPYLLKFNIGVNVAIGVIIESTSIILVNGLLLLWIMIREFKKNNHWSDEDE